MKVHLQRTLSAPQLKVWDEYTAPGNRARWDPTLASYEALQGRAGQPGALAHVTYRENGTVVRTTEWVTERTVPIVYRAVHDTPVGVLRVDNRFTSAGEGTRWDLFADLRLNGARLKLMSPLLRRRLRARLEREMDNFDDYVAGREKSPLEPGLGPRSLRPAR